MKTTRKQLKDILIEEINLLQEKKVINKELRSLAADDPKITELIKRKEIIEQTIAKQQEEQKKLAEQIVLEESKPDQTTSLAPNANIQNQVQGDIKSSALLETATSLVTEEATTSVDTEETTELVATEKTTAPVGAKETTTPVEIEEKPAPIEAEENTELVATEKTTAPVVSKQSAEPLEVEETTTLVEAKETTEPVEAKEAVTPAPPIETSASVQAKETLTPLETRETAVPTEVKTTVKSPLKPIAAPASEIHNIDFKVNSNKTTHLNNQKVINNRKPSIYSPSEGIFSKLMNYIRRTALDPIEKSIIEQEKANNNS